MLSKKQQLLKVETDIKKHFNKVSHFRWCLSTIIHSLLVSGLLNYNGGGSHVTNQTPNAGIYATDGFIVVPPGLDRFVKAWRFTFGWKEPPKFHLQDRFKGVTHVTPFKNANIYIYIIIIIIFVCFCLYLFECSEMYHVHPCAMYVCKFRAAEISGHVSSFRFPSVPPGVNLDNFLCFTFLAKYPKRQIGQDMEIVYYNIIYSFFFWIEGKQKHKKWVTVKGLIEGSTSLV